MKDFNYTAVNVDKNIVAIDALVQTSASKVYVVHTHSAEALPISVQNASYKGQDAAFIRVAVDDAELENYVVSAGSIVEVVELPDTAAARAKFVADWARKIAKKNKNGLLPLLLLPLKVTSKSWREMRQAAETKQEMRHINSSVTVMLHDRRGESVGLEPFCGLEIVEAASDRGVSLGANAFFLHPSLSRNLTGKPAITESRSRLRQASLSLSKSFLAEAHLARSASCVVSDVRTTAIDADGPRLRANKQQHRCLIASRPRDGVPSVMPTQPRAPGGLEAHTLNNVAARHPVACGPETHSCGAAVGHKI